MTKIPTAMQSTDYWEDRARRFASEGKGLAAVCSYGMPSFYNRYIQASQLLALRPWLQDVGNKKVLDVGCGVGRWSRSMALRGAQVTGVDLSSNMIAEARRRADEEGIGGKCNFMVQDLADLDTEEQYPLILGVTVLQHILAEDRLLTAIRRLASHLTTDGKLILLEAAPDFRTARCDTPIFTARSRSSYLKWFSECGLTVTATSGVDPMPLKSWFLPYYRRLPRPVALAGLAAVTLASLPVDALLGRVLVQKSWHKLFILEHNGTESDRG